MKIRYLFFLMFSCESLFLNLRAQDTLLKRADLPTFQLWLSNEAAGKITKNFSLGFEQGHIFDDMSDYTGMGLLSGLYYHFHKSAYVGFELVAAQGKSGHALWTKSVTPRLAFDYEFEIGGLKTSLDVVLRHRMIDTVKSRSGFDVSLDVDIISTGHGAMYLSNRIFYNFNGNHTFDEYWPSFGFEGIINKYLKWDISYIFEYFRPSGKKTWDHIHVLSADLCAYF